jgi:4-amino-4-deoxychorismate lyase
MLINGAVTNFLPLSDRGLAYGDGVFETIRYCNGRLLFEDLHLQRLQRACRTLDLTLDESALEDDIAKALRLGNTPHGVLKIIVTRGGGGRGYRPPRQQSTRIITLHPLPDYGPTPPEKGIRAFLCRQRLGIQTTLAGIKHLNRLEQVLASGEWPDDGFLEGLMLDQDGYVIEGTRSNLFFVRQGRLYTPDLARCGIDGIMRQVLLQHYGEKVESGYYTLADLYQAEEVFFCNSVFGVWPVLSLRAGTDEMQWQAGSHAREGSNYFHGVLQT